MASALLINLAILSAIIGIAYSVGIYEQCAGDGYGTFPCNAGLTCFRRNQFYSSCQYSCPLNQGWECERLVVVPIAAAPWEQCGGDGWRGPVICAVGFTCYARSVLYSQCRPHSDCPAGWLCRPVVATTTVIPTGPIILEPYSKCNNLPNTLCPVGTGCFRFNANYAECRPSCPATWACETDLVGLNEQCGGEGYVGLTACAPGLNCYARSQWYSLCAASCPGAGWIC